MSGTAATSTPSAASGNGTRVAIATWAPLAVSIVTLVIFGAAYLIAYLSKDTQTLTLFGGAVISMTTGAVNYWISSTAGSRAKDDRSADQMDRQTQALAASVPLAAVPPSTTEGTKP